jgi:hypothetical protein
VPIHYYGKKPKRDGAIRFMVEKYVDVSRLPTPPIVFGHILGSMNWQGDLGNDQCGDCVWAGAAHETLLWNHATRRPLPVFTDDSVVQVYSQETGYVPGVPSTDDGTDMQMAAEFRRVTGLPDKNGTRHFIKAYATIPITNDQAMFDLIMKLSYAFGALACGFNMQQAQADQFDGRQPWAPVQGSPILGGHYVPIGGRNSRGNALGVSWGRTTGITPQFIMQQCDEVIVYLSPEYLTINNVTPELLNLEQLNADLALLDIPHPSARR